MEKIRNELYIQHEINSLKDPKIIDLFGKHKVEGYGVYWLLLEYLQGTETGTIQEEQIEKIAPMWLQSDAEKAIAIVKTCLEIHLLEYSTDGEIFSPMLKEQREEMIAEKNKWKNFGKKGAEAKKKKAAEEAAKTATAETLTERNSNGGKDSLYSSPFATLCKVICDKFRVEESPFYYGKLAKLLEAIDGDSERAAAVVREGLAKLDTAKAIKNGRMTFTIEHFLNPDTFFKLKDGAYDKDHSKPRSRAADAGLTFSDIDY